MNYYDFIKFLKNVLYEIIIKTENEAKESKYLINQMSYKGFTFKLNRGIFRLNSKIMNTSPNRTYRW